jgi:hypothetical protein
MLLASSGEIGNQQNVGPTRLLGPAWLLIGIPLGLWLTLKGRLGLAGMALSPYLFPHYYLALLWEAAPGVDGDSIAPHAKAGDVLTRPQGGSRLRLFRPGRPPSSERYPPTRGGSG